MRLLGTFCIMGPSLRGASTLNALARSIANARPWSSPAFCPGVEFVPRDPKPSDLPMGKLTFARPGHQGLHPLLLQKKGMTCGKG